MFRTVEGERCLQGAEAQLFRLGVQDAVGKILLAMEDQPDEYLEFGPDVFDRLTRGQQIWLLHHVAHGLLREEAPCPELMAVIDAAVAAVFGHLLHMVEVEIEIASMSGDERFAAFEDRGPWTATPRRCVRG